MGPINGSLLEPLMGEIAKKFQKTSKLLFARFLHDNTLLMVLLMLPEWLKLSYCIFGIFWKILSSLPLMVLTTELPLMVPINGSQG